MANRPIIECIPNFSEGRRTEVIKAIRKAIQSVSGVQLMHVDPGHAANRTVMTFAGATSVVVEAAFLSIQTAAQLINMNLHSGTHPRMGATDVCPLVPIHGISMEETQIWADKLARRVGEELLIPVFLYENSAQVPHRRNLAKIRAGEYEGLSQKLKLPKWKPDYGPSSAHPTAGATVIGARDFLIAYNVNLNTKSSEIAQQIAEDIRESGRVLRGENGKALKDEEGRIKRIPGQCKSLKAIGWFIEEYDCAQVSMNLTNIKHTNMHEAFEACKSAARKYGVQVRGSELIGMAPLSCYLAAAKYYSNESLSERESVQLVIQKLGLDELSFFRLKDKVIDWKLMD